MLSAPGVAADATVGGSSPLHTAAKRGHAAVVTALLACPTVNINRLSTTGRTPLRLARDAGHVAVAAAIQAHGGALRAVL